MPTPKLELDAPDPLPPPPSYEVLRKCPSTVTMRALTDEDAPVRRTAAKSSSAAAFDDAVDAYLRRDYESALTLFETVLRSDPNHASSLNNVRVIRHRLGLPAEP